MHMIAYSGCYNSCIHTIKSRHDLSNTSLIDELLLCIGESYSTVNIALGGGGRGERRGEEGGEEGRNIGVPYCSINRALEGERGGGREEGVPTVQ